MKSLKQEIIRFTLWLTPQRYLAFMLLMFAAVTPQMAMAEWYDPLVSILKSAKTGLIIILGSIAVCALLYSGCCWLVSRMLGTMNTTAFDYAGTGLIIFAVSGSVAMGTFLYSQYGLTGS